MNSNLMNTNLSALTDRFADAFVQRVELVHLQGFNPESGDELLNLWNAISPETCAEYQAIREELLTEFSQILKVTLAADKN